MGRGDGRSRKGKTFKGSFGNSRPKGKKVLKARAKAKGAVKKSTSASSATAKKPAAKKTKE